MKISKIFVYYVSELYFTVLIEIKCDKALSTISGTWLTNQCILEDLESENMNLKVVKLINKANKAR